MSRTLVASRLVHTGTWSRPATGGRAGSDPVAITTWPASSSCPLASTRPGPASRAGPLMTVGPGLLVVHDLGGVAQVADHVVVIVARPGPVDGGGGDPGGPA